MGEGAGEDEDASALRTEIYTLLGLCLLRLQSCESMLKLLVAEGAFDGTPDTLSRRRSKRRASVAGSTLGGLVTLFIGSTLVEDADSIPSETDEKSHRQGSSAASRFRIAFPPEALPQVESGLKELVVLRNHLVHGFLAAHDLVSSVGCRRARDALLAAKGRIEVHGSELKNWLREFDAAREQMLGAISYPAVLKVILSGEEGDVNFTLPSLQGGTV